MRASPHETSEGRVHAFTGRTADVGEDLGVLSVGIAEHADSDGRLLVFMSPLPGDAETSLCVTNEAGDTAFGGISEILLSRDLLRVKFRAGVGYGLRLPDNTEIPLALAEKEFEALAKGLADVLSRCADPPKLDVAAG